MRILVTGGTGVVGSKLVEVMSRKGEELHYTFGSRERAIDGGAPHRLDFTDAAKTTELVAGIRPDAVVHAGALVDVKACEADRARAELVNVAGTRNVCDACRGCGARVIFVSTSAVFDGKKEIYSEVDERRPVNVYGETKARGEDIASESAGSLIVRVNQAYGWVRDWQKKNLVLTTLEKLERGEEAREVADWYDTPTLTDNLAEMVHELIVRGKSGVYHTVGPDFVSRYEWARKVAKVFGKDETLVKKMSGSEVGLNLARPSVHMSNEKVCRELETKALGLEDGLSFMLAQRRG